MVYQQAFHQSLQQQLFYQAQQQRYLPAFSLGRNHRHISTVVTKSLNYANNNFIARNNFNSHPQQQQFMTTCGITITPAVDGQLAIVDATTSKESQGENFNAERIASENNSCESGLNHVVADEEANDNNLERPSPTKKCLSPQTLRKLSYDAIFPKLPPANVNDASGNNSKGGTEDKAANVIHHPLDVKRNENLLNDNSDNTRHKYDIEFPKLVTSVKHDSREVEAQETEAKKAECCSRNESEDSKNSGSKIVNGVKG